MIKKHTYEYLKNQMNSGNYIEVIDSVNEAINSNSSSVQLEFLMACSYTYLEEYLEAEKIYKNILNSNSRISSDVYYNLATVCCKLGKQKDAAFYCRQYVNLNPQIPEGYRMLGEIYMEAMLLGESLMSFHMALILDNKNSNIIKGLAECYRKIGNKEKALEFLLMQDKSPRRDMNILESYYVNGNKKLFNDKLIELNQDDKLLPLVACLSAHASIRFSQRDNYNFCSDPMSYINHYSLGENDLNENFINNIITTIEKYNFDYKAQDLLTNGSQTLGYGNLFDLQDEAISDLKKIVERKINEYREFYKNETNGFFKKWPKKGEYKLTGWLIDLKTGGSLKPHIHKEGWLSGSLYLKVPKKNKKNEGDIKFSLGGLDAYPEDGKFFSEKIIELNTGDLVLFPSSIFHSTIPFSSNEKRLTFAFDIIPNYMFDR